MNYFNLFWKSYLVLFLTFSTRVLCCSTGVGSGGTGSASAPQNFWIGENPGKIRENLGKISENRHKVPENLSKPLKIRAKMASNGSQYDMKSFFWRSLFMKLFSSKFGRTREKNPSHAQKFACSYTYAAPPQI